MATALSHKARFELCTAKTWPNPWPMYRALRDDDPVHHVVPKSRPGSNSQTDYYVLSRHSDI
jgi:cytochrome P450 family 130